MTRECMEFDVVVVGAGPAGLSAAYHLKHQADNQGRELSVCVIEKGSEVGAHILSGAIVEPRALDDMIPDWREKGAPLHTKVKEDRLFLLKSDKKQTQIPNAFIPKTMHNSGNYITSVGNLSRWLAEQAQLIGVEIFPGFAAADILYHADGRVKGVATGDMGVGRDGQPKDGYMPGMELHATYTVFAEGSRGHLGKQLIERFSLDENADPQHYGIGLKELWDIDPELHEPGLVVHGSGWPLDDASGGFFLYHGDDCQVMVGLIVDLNYSNPYLSPFDEFQRLKHHPVLANYLKGGKRVAYGARALTKGGLNALPKMTFPGGLLIGCEAGTLNFAKIKGTHTAMQSGILAANAILSALNDNVSPPAELTEYTSLFEQSWLYDELKRSRNFGPALHKFGSVGGGMFNYIDQNWFGGKLPVHLRDLSADHAQLTSAAHATPIDYPKPDGVLSFDKLSSVFLSNTNHEEEQPCHLTLADSQIPINQNLPEFAEPAQRYCPAGVYEITKEGSEQVFVINAQNCVHCKTCDIKDPAQNITWTAPEGGGGPNYPNM